MSIIESTEGDEEVVYAYVPSLSLVDVGESLYNQRST